MKVVQINATCGIGSTGRICSAIAERLSARGIENYILYSAGKTDDPHGIRYMSDIDTKLQALTSRIFGNYGFNSVFATRSLIRKLDEIQPDIVHLHNIHAHNCHLEGLFSYLKEKKIRVFWTFHDCWAFTGYCPHFTMVRCDRWLTQCEHCVVRKKYSWFFDRSGTMQARKKKMVEGVDLTIITPSDWLAGLVRQSFFKDCPIHVVNNGIDQEIFQPTTSDFKERNGLSAQKIVLGVSFCWEQRKGLDVFIRLRKELDSRYTIVLVGTDEQVDKILPEGILSIHRTHDQHVLAALYSAADVFVNPTREDTYPTVNMEAISCGCPVITFDVGGCREMVTPESGAVLAEGDVAGILRCLSEWEQHPLSQDRILQDAKRFNCEARYEELCDLYDEGQSGVEKE